MKSFKHISIIAMMFIGLTSYSQCNTNTSICTTGTAGPFGFNTPGAPVSTCLDFFGPSVSYITLHITSGGPLEMLIDGNATTGFIDVAIFNVPLGMDPCTAITDNANEIGCNYASASSGCNQFGTSFGCPSSVPAPMVNAGDELMIVVENWSGASFTFELELSGSGAQTGPPDATITAPTTMVENDPPVSIIAANGGGNWSASCGTCIDATTGMFDPSLAGPGNHTVCYDIGVAPCNGQDCKSIFVNMPLGVEMKYVDLNCSDRMIYLDWATMTEENCDFFEVERSRDGINFETMKKIPGNGNSSEETTYSHIEPYDREGNYYRLSQTDFNGERTEIGVYHATCKQTNVTVSPNPSENEILVSYENFTLNQTTIQLFDNLGRLISSESGNPSGESKMMINDLEPHMYTLIIQDPYQRKAARFTKL